MCAHAGVKHGRKQLNNLQHEKKGENVVGSRRQTVTNPTHQLVKTCRWMSNSFCFSSIPVWLVWLSHDGACKDCKLFNWTARAQVESHSIWIPMFELLAEPDWTLLGRVTLILFGRFYIFWTFVGSEYLQTQTSSDYIILHSIPGRPDQCNLRCIAFDCQCEQLGIRMEQVGEELEKKTTNTQS